MDKIRTLLVDDNALFRKMIRRYLAKADKIELIGEAGTSQEAIKMVEETRPDLVLMDIRIPDENGLTITRRLKEKFPELQVVILTLHDNWQYRQEAEKCGASAYVLKKDSYADLMPAIESLFSEATS
jgi:DNA-binding NarL/FixJ family response regulator